MPWVEKHGRLHRVAWDNPDGSRGHGKSMKRSDADRELHAIEVAMNNYTFIDPAKGRTLFATYTAQWLSTRHGWRASTRETAESYIRNHVLPAFGPRPIGAITRTEVEGWVGKLVAQGKAPATVGIIFHFMQSIMRGAVKDQMIPASPCIDIALPRKDDRQIVPPSDEEVDSWIEATPAPFRAVTILGAGSGMRIGECLALTQANVLWTQRKVRVQHTLVTPQDGPAQLGPPKTKAGYREIPVSDEVLEALSERIRQYPSDHPDRLIFANTRESAIRRGAWGNVWSEVRAITGTTETFHSLRHYFASVMIHSREVDLKRLQKWLGHASAVETLDLYGHLMPDDDQEDAARLVMARRRRGLGARESLAGR